MYFQTQQWRLQCKLKKDEDEAAAQDTERRSTHDSNSGEPDGVKMRPVGAAADGAAADSQPIHEAKESGESDQTEEAWGRRNGGRARPLAILAPMTSLIASLGPKDTYGEAHQWTREPWSTPRVWHRFFFDLIFFKHTAADYIILAMVSALACSVVALGVHLAQYEDPAASYFVASLIGVVIFTFFTLLKFFNTFTVGIFQVLVLIGLLVWTSIALDTVEQTNAIGAVGFALLYPAIC
jgi:hypothetical protein